MTVRELMSHNPQCCAPNSTVQEAAQMMSYCDCGAIPVVDEKNHGIPVGVITDRDIACRVAAGGKDPRSTLVSECMSHPPETIQEDASIEQCCQRMKRSKIRRLPVVNAAGQICGIVSQADVALQLPEHETAEVVRKVSEPMIESSLVGAG